MSDLTEKIDRRSFLKSATIVAGGAAFASTALSYQNIAGANDRISLTHIGIGSRGGELDQIAAELKTSHRVEMTALRQLAGFHNGGAGATPVVDRRDLRQPGVVYPGNRGRGLGNNPTKASLGFARTARSTYMRYMRRQPPSQQGVSAAQNRKRLLSVSRPNGSTRS